MNLSFSPQSVELLHLKPPPVSGMGRRRRCDIMGCYDVPLFGYKGQKGNRCEAHKLADMIRIWRQKPTCDHPGCKDEAYFALQGQTARSCILHKSEDMVLVRGRKCKYEECVQQPTFGYPDGQAHFCALHRQEGMVKKSGWRCEEDGCPTAACFGMRGEKPTRCHAHKEEGSVRVKANICKTEGCHKQPLFGVPNGPRLYCHDHKQDEHVNIGSRKCEEDSCMRKPVYGPCFGKPIYCSTHTKPNMVNAVTQRCRHEGCTKQATYGMVGKGRRFCMAHKELGMTNLKGRLVCEHPGCTKTPSYGFAHTKNRRFCASHKPLGCINQLTGAVLPTAEIFPSEHEVVMDGSGLGEYLPEVTAKVMGTRHDEQGNRLYKLEFSASLELTEQILCKFIDNHYGRAFRDAHPNAAPAPPAPAAYKEPLERSYLPTAIFKEALNNGGFPGVAGLLSSRHGPLSPVVDHPPPVGQQSSLPSPGQVLQMQLLQMQQQHAAAQQQQHQSLQQHEQSQRERDQEPLNKDPWGLGFGSMADSTSSALGSYNRMSQHVTASMSRAAVQSLGVASVDSTSSLLDSSWGEPIVADMNSGGGSKRGWDDGPGMDAVDHRTDQDETGGAGSLQPKRGATFDTI